MAAWRQSGYEGNRRPNKLRGSPRVPPAPTPPRPGRLLLLLALGGGSPVERDRPPVLPITGSKTK